MKKWKKMVDEIIETMEEEGELIWDKPWVGGRPKNAKTGRPYSGVNVLNLNRIMGQKGYENNLWLTYNQAQDLGGYVKKGSSGSTIIYWNFYEKEVEKEVMNKKGEKTTKEVTEKVGYLKSYTVFNIAQTTLDVENLNLEIAPLDEFEDVAGAEALIEAQPGLDLRHNEPRAYFEFRKDFINMPKKKKFKSERGYYASLFHELTHWTGHSSRLDRELNGSKLSNDYSKEELVAELGANFLCSEVGIERDVENSSAYIKGWLDTLKSNKRLLINASARASKSADYLLRNLKDSSEEEKSE